MVRLFLLGDYNILIFNYNAPHQDLIKYSNYVFVQQTIVELLRYVMHACVLSGSKTGGTKAPAIQVHLMNYSHRSLMHAVATHVNYFNAIINNI